MSSVLNNLLACAYGTCIINAGKTNLAVEDAIRETTDKGVLSELALSLPGCVGFKMDHRLVHQTCLDIIAGIWP